MKKMVLILVGVLAVAIFGGYLLYRTSSSGIGSSDLSPLTNHDPDRDAFISTFFSYAQEQIPNLEAEIKKLSEDPAKNEKELLENQDLLNLYQIVDLIAQRKIDALKSLDSKQLSFAYGQIGAPGDKFDPKFVPSTKPGEKGDPSLFAYALLGGENALAFVLANSARDKTIQDKKDSLAMIQLLLEKNLNPSSLAGIAYFIKDSPTSKSASDYPRYVPLLLAAVDWSYPEAAELILKHIAQNTDKTVSSDINIEDLMGRLFQDYGEEKKSDLEAFKTLFRKYPREVAIAMGAR